MPFVYEQDRRKQQQMIPQPRELPEPASFAEAYSAAFQYAVDEEMSISGVLNRQGWRQRSEAVQQLIDDGQLERDQYADPRGRLDYNRLAEDFETVKSDAQLREERKEFLRQRREQNQDVMERGSGLAQFAGMGSAFIIDPVNLATLPFSSAVGAARSLSWVGRGLLTARREAALSAAAELAIQPLVYQHKSDIDSPYSWRDAVANIGLAATGSAGLGFASGGIAGYLKSVRAKSEPFVDPEVNDVQYRSLDESADYLDKTRPESAARVLDEEYGKFINEEYSSIEEVRAAARSRLQADLAQAQSDQVTIARMVADEGGLNEKAWKDAGLDVDDIKAAKTLREQLPKGKPLFRRKAGLNPEQLAARLIETNMMPAGATTENSAIEFVQSMIKAPGAEANPEAAAKAADIQNTLARLETDNEDELTSVFQEAQKAEIDGDAARLTELEENRLQMNRPSKTQDKYFTRTPKATEAQTLHERERALLEDMGLADEYDQAFEEYARAENKQLWDSQSERLIDPDEAIEEIDEQIEGINEVLRCTVGA